MEPARPCGAYPTRLLKPLLRFLNSLNRVISCGLPQRERLDLRKSSVSLAAILHAIDPAELARRSLLQRRPRRSGGFLYPRPYLGGPGHPRLPAVSESTAATAYCLWRRGHGL